MGSINFFDDMATIQRSVAKCPDQIKRRDSVLDIICPGEGQSILEIGCGSGLYAYETAKKTGQKGSMSAIDYSKDQIEAAKNYCSDIKNIDFKVGDASNLPYNENSFDLVYAIQVFEYIDCLDRALKEVQRVIKPGGHFFILSTDWRTAVWHSFNPDRMQNILSAWETHSNTKNLPSVIRVNLRNAGFKMLKQTPMSFINSSYNKDSFSYWASKIIHAFVSKNTT